MKGTIYFSDGHTEEFTRCARSKDRGCVIVYAESGTYFDKKYYAYTSPAASAIHQMQELLLDMAPLFPSWIHVYFQRTFEISSDGTRVRDCYDRAAIDKIVYDREQPKPRASSIPNLVVVLRALNLNLDKLSLYTGISKKTLISYVEGEVKPRKETVDKIAKALGVSTDDLMRTDDIGAEMAMLTAVDNAAKNKKANAEILAAHFENFIKEKFGYVNDEDL